MLDLLLDFPDQCRAALEIGRAAKLSFGPRNFNKVVFCGLGGSAIGSDVVRAYLYFDCPSPILVLREYDLPAYIDSSTLLFVASYSGNTEEVLSAYQQAKAKGACLIALSSSGKLKELALADKVSFVQMPAGLPPRHALGYSSIIPLCILANLKMIDDVAPSVLKMAQLLEELKNNNLEPSVGLKDNIAKSIAHRLVNRFALVYSSSVYFDACAMRLRCQLAENSKVLASSNLFPEATHNEIMGWQNPQKLLKNFVAVFLRDSKMHRSVAKSMEISLGLLKEEGIEAVEVWSRGEDLLSRIFSLIYIGDFISYYLAILYGVDPLPVERINYLKKELAKK